MSENEPKKADPVLSLKGEPRGRRWADRAPGMLARPLWRSGRRFSAVVTPEVIHLVEYEAHSHELDVTSYLSRRLANATPAEAAHTLAEMIGAELGNRAQVAVALSGFGTAHGLLRLPPAEPALLRPVVEREFAREHPAAKTLRIEYLAQGLNDARQGVRTQDIFVGAAPPAVVEAFTAALEERRIELQHMTVAPQAVQRVFDAFSRVNETVLVMFVVPGLSAMAAIRGGRLRLYWEPILRARDDGAVDSDIVRERLRQGIYYIAQELRGRRLEQVLIAAEPEHRDHLMTGAADIVRASVAVLGPEQAHPGALLALGAALDASDGRGLNLLPSAARPRSSSDRLVRLLAGATAAVVIATAVWWSATGTADARRAAARLAAVHAEYEERIDPMARIEPVVAERLAQAERTAFLRDREAERLRLQDLIGAIALSASPAIRLDKLGVARGEEGWRVTLDGMAIDYSGAAAMGAVDQLYRELPERLAVEQIQLTRLADAPADSLSGASRVSFAVELVVRATDPEGEAEP